MRYLLALLLVACGSEPAARKLELVDAPATGAIANDSATRKVNIVRPMRMDMLDAAGISVVGFGWSSDDFARQGTSP